MDDTLLGIGQVAKASGLTVSALRFYADNEVLVPAHVDPVTGYRLYRPDQVRAARLVAQLRSVGMPLPELRRAVDDPAVVGEVLDAHVRRLEAGLDDARRVSSTVRQLLRDQEVVVPLSHAPHHVHSGKVRELYAVDDTTLLVVATDRVSAFDHVLPTEVPDKGRVLTQLSRWWFEQLSDVVPNHLLEGDVPEQVRGRAMLCRRLDMLPVECVVRGYLTGSALQEYAGTGSVHGTVLPRGLVEGSRLPEPLFTPTTKAPVGDRDVPMAIDDLVSLVGAARARELRDVSLEVYRSGAALAEAAGLIVADTKLELGLDLDGSLVLADELLTPDSSRLWSAEQWEPGRRQASYDKQVVRDWLAGPSGWDRLGPSPALPEEVVAQTRARYLEVLERLTGRVL